MEQSGPFKENLPTSSPRRLKRRQKYCKNCICGVNLAGQTFYICWSVSSGFGQPDLCSASVLTCRFTPFPAPAVQSSAWNLGLLSTRQVQVVSMMSCLFISLQNKAEIYGHKCFKLFLFSFLGRRISIGERLFCKRLHCMIDHMDGFSTQGACTPSVSQVGIVKGT